MDKVFGTPQANPSHFDEPKTPATWPRLILKAQQRLARRTCAWDTLAYASLDFRNQHYTSYRTLTRLPVAANLHNTCPSSPGRQRRSGRVAVSPKRLT